MTFTHIVNPVKVPDSSDLFMAQPITFESMRRAKDVAEKGDMDISVRLASCCFPEDETIVPDYFEKTPNLTRSIQEHEAFSTAKKLPYIEDILRLGYEHANADYVVFTNVDISLYPHFYISVATLLQQGVDGLCINRRTLPNGAFSPSDLPKLYAEKGVPHEGIDCFVIKREQIPNMKLEGGIVGTGPVGLFIAHNLLQLSSHFQWIREERLTFHIGDDKNWLKGDMGKDSLLYYNYKALEQNLAHIAQTETDVHKSKVMESALAHARHFLEHQNLESGTKHRQKLAYFSDGDYDNLQVENEPKAEKSSKGIKSSIKKIFGKG